jgi:flagellar hook-length control protein FliK
MVTPAIQQQATSTAPKSTVTPGNRTQVGDDREDRPISDGFGALLAITRGTIDEQIKSNGDRATGQMFDAKGEEAGGDRVSQLNKEYRSAIGTKSDQLADARTGVDARNEAILSEAQRADGDRQIDGNSKADAGVAKAQDYFASLRTVGSRNDGAPSSNPPAEGSARFDIEVQSSATGSKPGANAPPPVDSAQGVGVTAGASAVAATTPTAPSVAEEVGQLLGASRIGEAQGARAASAPQAVADQRASSNDRQTQTSARAKQPETSANESKVVRENTRTPFDKLVGKMRLRMSENRSTAQLRLNPPELGRIRVDVRLVGDRLVVGVQAESEAARELLSQRADSLKATLKEHGIQIDRFEVVSNTNDGSPNPTAVGGDTGGAKQSSRESMQSSSSPASRVTRGGANEEYDGVEAAGTATSVPTVAVDTRLDIRI